MKLDDIYPWYFWLKKIDVDDNVIDHDFFLKKTFKILIAIEIWSFVFNILKNTFSIESEIENFKITKNSKPNNRKYQKVLAFCVPTVDKWGSGAYILEDLPFI